MAEEKKPLSRSEREALIKDKAGLVIVFMALFLAANTYLANGFSSTAQTNLLQASNTYGFYQSKSIKQTDNITLVPTSVAAKGQPMERSRRFSSVPLSGG